MLGLDVGGRGPHHGGLVAHARSHQCHDRIVYLLMRKRPLQHRLGSSQLGQFKQVRQPLAELLGHVGFHCGGPGLYGLRTVGVVVFAEVDKGLLWG